MDSEDEHIFELCANPVTCSFLSSPSSQNQNLGSSSSTDEMNASSGESQPSPPQPMKVNLPMQEKLERLHSLLGHTGQPVPGSGVRQCWREYLEMQVEPYGWTAIWKPKTCMAKGAGEECALDYITPQTEAILVEIYQVNFHLMEAQVMLVQEMEAEKNQQNSPNDIGCLAHLTKEGFLDSDYKIKMEKFIRSADLMDLFPIEKHHLGGPNVTTTAIALHLLRFFYNQLWFSWDEDDKCEDWPRNYLESRVQFIYDLESGLIPREAARRIQELMREARRIGREMEALQVEMEWNTEELDVDAEVETHRMMTAHMLEMHVKQKQLREHLRLMEDPVTRALFLESSMAKKRSMGICSTLFRGGAVMEAPEVALVWEGGSLDALQDFIARVKELSEDQQENPVTIFPNLERALENVSGGAKVYIPLGTHEISYSGNLEEKGGAIIGTSTNNVDTVLKFGGGGDVFLSVSSGCLSLMNLSLQPLEARTTLLVQSQAKMSLINCSLIAQSNDFERQEGVLVLSDGIVEATGVELKGYYYALCLRGGAKASLKNLQFNECAIAMQIGIGASLDVSSTCMSKCRVGIQVECSSEDKSVTDGKNHLSGSFDLLERCSLVCTTDVSVVNTKSPVELKKLFDADVFFNQ